MFLSIMVSNSIWFKGEFMRNCIGIILIKTGKKQSHLARKVNLSRSTVNLIVSGQQNPSLKKAFAIAEAMNCKVDELFFPTSEEMFGE